MLVVLLYLNLQHRDDTGEHNSMTGQNSQYQGGCLIINLLSMKQVFFCVYSVTNIISRTSILQNLTLSGFYFYAGLFHLSTATRNRLKLIF